MAPNVTNPSQQAKVWVNGQYKPAVKDSDGKWYVVDDNGKRIAVDPNDLFGINSNLTEHPQHLVDYYDDLLKKSEERKDYLEAAGNMIRAQLKGAKDKYASILASFGVKKYDEITDSAQKADAKKYYSSVSDLSRAKTRNSNDFYSACMRSFDYALEKGEWQNQLSVAQHVMNSLG